MLNEINSLLKYSQIIGIQDTAADPGKFLINEFISNSNHTKIHVLCYDCGSNILRKELSGVNKTFHFYDCLPQVVSNPDAEDKLEEVTKPLQEERNGKFLVIDSVSTMFLQKPAHVVYRILDRIIDNVVGRYENTRIFVVVHEDTLLNPRPIITHLKLLCNVWIRTQGPRINLTVRKHPGKLSIENYTYDSSSNEKIVWHKEEKNDTPSKPESNEGPVSTFKLTLSESEKKARDAVKLPYERYDGDNEPGSSAAIIYEPDEFDDWDEEDPDNDLEFS